MLFLLHLAKALRNNPQIVLLKLVGCFVSYQFSCMFVVFIAGMSMNAGYWKISLGLALGSAFVYGVKGDPVGFWRNVLAFE